MEYLDIQIWLWKRYCVQHGVVSEVVVSKPICNFWLEVKLGFATLDSELRIGEPRTKNLKNRKHLLSNLVIHSALDALI
jgi:hypothetical protein